MEGGREGGREGWACEEDEGTRGGGEEARTNSEKAEGAKCHGKWEEKGRRSIFPSLAAVAPPDLPPPASSQSTLELQLTMLITRTAPVKTLATRT